MASFMALSERVRAAREAGDVDGALAALDGQESRLPLHAGLVHLLRAELLVAAGRYDDALDALERALDAGCRYAEPWLADDPRLEPLAPSARFRDIVARSARRYAEEQTAARPRLWMAIPDEAPPAAGYPLVVALHGNNSNLDETRDRWSCAADLGWALAVPQSGEIGASPNAFTWNDRDRTAREVDEHLRRLGKEVPVDVRRFVVAGFSMGATQAIALALTGALPAPPRGVVPIAAWLGHIGEFTRLIEHGAAKGLRAYVVVGEHDGSRDGARGLVEALVRSGVEAHLDERPGLGHEYPADMAATLRRALATVGRRLG